jgi:polyisoprenoid-binding protein YceI
MPEDPRTLTREQYERRRRQTRITMTVVVAVIVLVIVAVVVPSVYRNHENAEAKPVPSVAATRAASTLAPAEINGPWTITKHSTAGYRVHEVLNGQPVTVTGRTSDVSGTATIASGAITSAQMSVKVSTIHTDSRARDSYFRDSALDVQSFPTATFRLTSTIPNAVPAAGTTRTSKATGELTLHGVTRRVTATIESGLSGGGAEISGSIPITFSDYGVEAPSLGFVTVQKKGAVEFQLDAKPAAGATQGE